MPDVLAWPQLQPLAERIAVGELDGDEAIAAIVEAIVERELGPGARGAVADAVRRDALGAVRQDRLLMAMLRPLVPTPIDDIGARPSGPRRSSVRVRPDELDAAAGSFEHEADGGGPDPYARVHTSRRIVASAGVVIGIVIGLAAWWMLLRETPCEHLARQACLELSGGCSAAEIGKHLATAGIDDARCTTARDAAVAAANAVDPSKRARTYEKALVAELGIDPRTGTAPVASASEAPAPTPVLLARGLPALASFGADEAFVYLAAGDAVLRLRSTGGTFETLAVTGAPSDVVATTDFVYWRARAADGTEGLFVDRKRGEYEPQAIPIAPAKPARARCIEGLCAFVDAADGSVAVVAQDGTPPRKLTGPATPAPTSIWLDDAEVAWAIGGPQGVVAAIGVAGGVSRIVAGAEQNPRELVGDASGLYWISDAGVRGVARAGGDVVTLSAQPAGAIAIDGQHVYAADPQAGTITAIARDGGGADVIVQGQAGVGRLALDGAAIYWEHQGELLRQAK